MGENKRSSAGRWAAAATGAALAGVVGHDLKQRKHAILRNFPVVGHFRYWLEHIGPELRQYIVTSNDEERPFTRDQRRWVYASSKKEINTFGFGSDNEMEAVDNLLVVKHASFPHPPPSDGEVGGAMEYLLPVGKVLGGAHGRRHAFRPQSVVNISAISGVTLQAGSIPPSPGFAPWESLISIARTGADAARSASRSSEKSPRASRQPK